MKNIFKKIAEQLDLIPPEYTREEFRQYQDGFATGYPLVGQPDYPKHNTPAYRRGVRYGIRAFRQAGQPEIKYEESEVEG